MMRAIFLFFCKFSALMIPSKRRKLWFRSIKYYIIHPAFMLLHTKLTRNITLNWFLQTTTTSFVYPACWTENKHSNSNILYLNTIGFKAQRLWGRVQIKLIKSNLIKCSFVKREENRSTRGKTYQSRDKLNPHMTPSLEIEPGTHWWEASAFERSRLTLW